MTDTTPAPEILDALTEDDVEEGQHIEAPQTPGGVSL